MCDHSQGQPLHSAHLEASSRAPSRRTSRSSGEVESLLRRSKKREVIHSACATCSRGKIKCDGGRPSCHGCTTKGIHCVYPTEPGQTRQAALRRRNSELEHELESMKILISTLRTLPPIEAAEYLKSIPVDSGASQSTKPPSQPVSPVQPQDQRTSLPDGNYHMRQFELVPLSDNMTATVPSACLFELAATSFFEQVGTLFYLVTQDEMICMQIELRKGARTALPASLAQVCAISAMASGEIISLKLTEAFSAAARVLLDSIIEASPKPAMKVAAILAMYSIVNKSTLALDFTELGLSLGRRLGLHLSEKPPWTQQRDWIEDRKVFESLTCFLNWSAPSLNSVVANLPSAQHAIDPLSIAEETDLLTVVQSEIVRIHALKADILKTYSKGNLSTERVQVYRDSLEAWQNGLPPSMQLASLLKDGGHLPRFMIYFLHLVYLNTSTLLYQRIMLHFLEHQGDLACDQAFYQVAYNVSEDGSISAMQTIRIVSLMMSEAHVFQRCWTCISSVYISGAILLHQSYGRVLNRTSTANISCEITAAGQAVKILENCSRYDRVADKLHDILVPYYRILALKAQEEGIDLATPGPVSATGDGGLGFPFRVPKNGLSVLHKGTRDLIRILCRSFGSRPRERPSSTVVAPANEAVQQPSCQETDVLWSLVPPLEDQAAAPVARSQHLSARPDMPAGWDAAGLDNDEAAVLEWAPNSTGILVGELELHQHGSLGNDSASHTPRPFLGLTASQRSDAAQTKSVYNPN